MSIDDELLQSEAAEAAASGGTLTIDLDAIAGNYRYLASRTKAEAGASVKADGYGLGLVPVVNALASAGCRTFFVASVEEGGALRAALPDAVIYVLNGLFSGSEKLFVSENLRPCLSSVEEVREWAAFRKHSNAPATALHGDTGIHRLGFPPTDADEIAALAQNFEVSLLMSHLACADDPESELNMLQRRRFDALRATFPGVAASLSNTAGVLLDPVFHYDLVRPGIGLYGGNPFDTPGHPFKPVVTLAARIMRVITIEPGESVGYGATFTADRPTRIATLAAGYADGYFRVLSSADGKGLCVSIAGHRAPIIGRVSMDMITVDVTDLPPEAVRRGDFAELIGAQTTVNEVGRAAGTIGYEVLTRLGYRYRRTYTSASGISSL
ncbi:MAG: alanine racemase [Parvibaculaceae bacterium]